MPVLSNMICFLSERNALKLDAEWSIKYSFIIIFHAPLIFAYHERAKSNNTGNRLFVAFRFAKLNGVRIPEVS